MGFVFRPAVEKNDGVYVLPGPIVRLQVQDQWDFDQFKVPLFDGDCAAGHSRNGVDISVEGQIASRDGNLKLSEEEMFTEYEAMRSVLDVTSEDDEYSFYLFYDGAEGANRKYLKCSTVRFDSDLSNPHLYTYSLLVHAEDPVLYGGVVAF